MMTDREMEAETNSRRTENDIQAIHTCMNTQGFW